MDILLDVISSATVAAAIAEAEEPRQVLLKGATCIGTIMTATTTMRDVAR